MAPAAPAHISFAKDAAFQARLKQQVDAFFAETGKRRRDVPAMYVKTAIVLGTFFTVYALLVFAAHTWWQSVPLVIALGFATAAIGLNIQHDGGHQAYSDRAWVNDLMARTMDVIGASSYFWRSKHGILHHTYVNITGQDDDINVGPLARLTPHQRFHRFHRLQHIYMWGLYAFMAMRWQLFSDFRSAIIGKIGAHRVARPTRRDALGFWGGKAVFVALAFVIPMLRHPWWQVLLFYTVAAGIVGIVLSIVFQLAHCVEEAQFPMPDAATGTMARPWAVHQAMSTVDFARHNRVLTWCLGGLNFQIEHHLFPRVCHIHYPALSRVVKATCDEFGVPYAEHPTFRAGIASHARWLKRMGRREA